MQNIDAMPAMLHAVFISQRLIPAQVPMQWLPLQCSGGGVHQKNKCELRLCSYEVIPFGPPPCNINNNYCMDILCKWFVVNQYTQCVPWNPS